MTPNSSMVGQPRRSSCQRPRIARAAGTLSITAPIATRQVTAAAGDQPAASRPLARAPEVPKAADETTASSKPVSTVLFIGSFVSTDGPEAVTRIVCLQRAGL